MGISYIADSARQTEHKVVKFLQKCHHFVLNICTIHVVLA